MYDTAKRVELVKRRVSMKQAERKDHNFVVTVTDTSHNDWHGTLCRPDGTSQEFSSVFELLKIMDALLEAEQPVRETEDGELA